MALLLINNNPILIFLIYQYVLNNIIYWTCTEIGNSIGIKSDCGIASQQRHGRTCDSPMSYIILVMWLINALHHHGHVIPQCPTSWSCDYSMPIPWSCDSSMPYTMVLWLFNALHHHGHVTAQCLTSLQSCDSSMPYVIMVM